MTRRELEQAVHEFAEVTGWYGVKVVSDNRAEARLSLGQLRYLSLLVKADKKDNPNR
jgi:hypothetical protein